MTYPKFNNLACHYNPTCPIVSPGIYRFLALPRDKARPTSMGENVGMGGDASGIITTLTIKFGADHVGYFLKQGFVKWSHTYDTCYLAG